MKNGKAGKLVLLILFVLVVATLAVYAVGVFLKEGTAGLFGRGHSTRFTPALKPSGKIDPGQTLMICEYAPIETSPVEKPSLPPEPPPDQKD